MSCIIMVILPFISLDIQLSERPNTQDEDRVQTAARSVREKKKYIFLQVSCANIRL